MSPEEPKKDKPVQSAEPSAAEPKPSSPAAESQAAGLPDLAKELAAAQAGKPAAATSVDLLQDVELDVKIELGRTRMLVEDVLRLGEGSIVEIDKLAGDPVDIYVNERLVARGEVLVLNDNFCVRVSQIVADQTP
ncbi:MAG: flagellar motor switch protein FliN [Phycisphaerae bacterium]|nr:flagellar motor switch protein FliN [Phycisphaerae bacterium]